MYLESSSRLNFHLCNRLEGQAHGSQERHQGAGCALCVERYRTKGSGPQPFSIFELCQIGGSISLALVIEQSSAIVRVFWYLCGFPILSTGMYAQRGHKHGGLVKCAVLAMLGVEHHCIIGGLWVPD